MVSKYQIEQKRCLFKVKQSLAPPLRQRSLPLAPPGVPLVCHTTFPFFCCFFYYLTPCFWVMFLLQFPDSPVLEIICRLPILAHTISLSLKAHL